MYVFFLSFFFFLCLLLMNNMIDDEQLDKMIRLLGQGTFGKVVECYDNHTGQRVAIKIIKAVPKYREAAKIELRVLQTIQANDGPANEYLVFFFLFSPQEVT